MKTTSLNNHLVVPTIEKDGTVSYITMKNTMVGAYAQRHGITAPVILKQLNADGYFEDYRERTWALKKQLCPLTPESNIEVFGQPLQDVYEPVYLMGSKRDTVFMARKELATKLKSLYKTPEEALAYRGPINEYPSEYGLHELNDVKVKVISDDQGSMSYDGIGFAATSVFRALGAQDLIQVRCASKDFQHGGSIKGLVQREDNLPEGVIHFTESQVKGIGDAFHQGRVTDLWIGVMRQYNKQSYCSNSWTVTDLPDFLPVKKNLEPEAVKEAHKLMDIVSDVHKAGDYLSLFDSSDDQDQRPYSMMENLIRISAGATNKSLPDMSKHRWIQRGMMSIVSDKLKGLALRGAMKMPYLLSVGCTHEHGEKAILCHEGKIGQKATIFRFPFIMAGITGTIVGRPKYKGTLVTSPDLRSSISLDDDGDCVNVVLDETFIACNDKARSRIEDNLDKQKEKKCSSWHEILDVQAEQACSSGGIGVSTFSVIGSMLQKDYKTANECARHLQAACDSRKHNVRPDLKYCREVFERTGLSPWLSVGKNEKSQFKTKVDSFPESSLWQCIREVWLERKDEMNDNSINLRSFANIFGFDHGLTKEEYRHCVLLYRYWCSRTSKLSALQDDNQRKEAFSKLVDEMKLATVCFEKKHVIASWEIAHQSQNPSATASYVFSVFSDTILELLRDAYSAKELVHLDTIDERPDLTKEQYTALAQGLRGKLIPTGAPLNLSTSRDSEEHGDGQKSTPQAKALKTVALVGLKDIKPEQLAEEIRNGRAVAKVDEKRPLPAQGDGAFGVGVWFEDREVAQVADHDVPVFKEVGALKGEAICFGRSLKLVSCVS